MAAAEGQLARALAFVHRNLDLTADSVRCIDSGLIVRTPSLPNVWALNQVRILSPITLAELYALVDVQLDGLRYRHVVVEDDRIGRGLEPSLRVAGWRMQRELLMALDGQPRPRQTAVPRQPAVPRVTAVPRQPAVPDVIEAAEPDMLELTRRWVQEEHNPGPEETDELVEVSRREGRAWREQRFGVIGEDGRLAAITKLRSDGRTAQVEDVYTAPEARGRGFARTLVGHASAIAVAERHELVFIIADDQDWPKQLYARLGFEPIGRVWGFHRGPG